MTRAVIDIGTQSTNLLVRSSEGPDLARTIVSTRLGEDLSATGLLSEAAMERTIATVLEHLSTATGLGADSIVITGTAACRRASNSTDFAGRIAEATGIPLTVLSEQQEAELTYVGAVSDLPSIDGSTLVIDIGGGSTEYTIGFATPEMHASIPFGSVTSTSSHISADPAPPEDLTNLIGAVADELEEIGRDMPAIATATRVIGVAGTIVTIAAIEIGLASFDQSRLHGFTLTKDAAEDVFRTMATENRHERLSNPGLPPERADIIVAGCCILVASMRRLQLDELVVSTRNLLDGVIADGRLFP